MRRIRLARALWMMANFLPKRYPVEGDLDRQPFFVFGSGRNGSTLLNRILNQHDELFAPPEQNFLGISIMKFHLYNFLNWRDLVKVIGGELFLNDGTHHWEKVDTDVLTELIHSREKSLQKIIESLYISSKQKKSSFEFWGDTTPQNTRFTKEIFQTFPQAKYIFLLRNGLDVVASYKNGTTDMFGELVHLDNSLKLWQNSLRSYEWLSTNTNCLLIKYEDLVQNPDEILHKICAHLSIDFNETLLEYHQKEISVGLHKEEQHSNINQPVFSSSIGKYEKILTVAELDKANLLLRKDLVKYGY